MLISSILNLVVVIVLVAAVGSVVAAASTLARHLLMRGRTLSPNASTILLVPSRRDRGIGGYTWFSSRSRSNSHSRGKQNKQAAHSKSNELFEQHLMGSAV